VTGAASGIGLATASLFVEQGATVVGVDANKGCIPALAALGPDVYAMHADITDPGAPGAIIEQAESLNGPDLLVNCAGIMHSADLQDMASTDWDRVFSVNVRAMFRLCQAALRTMLARKSGAIVNVSSVMALRAEPGSAAYSASKSAVLALTRDIAVSYATRGVRCNAGWVDTPMNAQYVAEVGADEAGARVALQQPLGRMLRPEEVAKVIAFLCSPDASGMTGACVPVDGGMSSYYST
jgi:NAD(P)-dependent dehydrogenase (short-subunit alcohol dehydrogenase family)